MSCLTENFKKETVEEFADAAYTVASMADANGIIDLLYDMQNEVLKGDYLETITDKERSEIAFKFLVLRDFLRRIQKIVHREEATLEPI